MAASTIQSLLFSSCSVLMSFLFAYSASVQLNDPDWYFWFPLYAIAFVVNLFQVSFTSKLLGQVALLALWGGILLLLKVIVEDSTYGLAGFWSLDMEERVVREKIGSGLVVISMILHLKSSQVSTEPKRKRQHDSRFALTGMAILVAMSYGLSLYFFAFVKEHMIY
ncbi:uncharacterized protein [Typha angustifolia]|uniref:uncharacterized protein n=1 Tax=Typha angustifolia TaxID=59011 RepID=UPI003C2CF7FE